MNRLDRIDNTISTIRNYRQAILRALIVLLLINYTVVTILLRDFILLKFMRDFLLIALFVSTVWKSTPKRFVGFNLLCVFVLTCIPASFRSVSLSLSLTLLRKYMFPLVLFFVVYQLQMEKRLQNFFRFLLSCFAILSIWGIFQAYVLTDQFLMNLGYPTEYAPHYQRMALYNSYYFGGFGIQRVVMTLSNSNACGLILGSTLILLGFNFALFKKKVRAFFLLGIIAMAYLLTFSRSNFLSMGVVMLLFALPYIPRKKVLFIALGCVAALVLLSGLLQGSDGFLFKLILWVRDSFTFKESSAAGRSGRWTAALDAVLRNPFGIGFGHVGVVAYGAGVREAYYSCENAFLATALDTGWLGMACYFGFILRQALHLRRSALVFRQNQNVKKERLCMSGFVIIAYFSIVFLFSNHVYDMDVLTIIFAYIAVLSKIACSAGSEKPLPKEKRSSNMLRKILNKLSMLFGNISMAFRSLFWRRRKDTVLFGAWFGDKFADNSRFLFQHLAENKEQYGLKHVVWVTRNTATYDMLKDMGYEVYMTDSKESIHFHKTACMHVVCNSTSNKNNTIPDIDIRYSFGAKRVNLWHGVGVVKGVGCASKEYQRRKAQNKLVYTIKETLEKSWLYRQFVTGVGGWGNFYFLSPTETDTKQFREFSFIPEKHFIESQYPRTCPCPKMTPREQAVVDILKAREKTLLYLPTFRTGDNTFDFSTLADHLKSVLAQENILWVQKAHSASRTDLAQQEDNLILNLSPDFDINVIMPYITMLVTDYSSAASDARFFHKPVLFYVPDLDAYTNGDNGVTEEAEELMRGPQYMDIPSLRAGLQLYINDPESAKPKDYNAIREKYWGEEKSLQQIWQDILTATHLS